MLLFLPDQFPNPPKVLRFPNEGNGKNNAGGDAWGLLHICLVTGGTLKYNFTFKRHHWAHKQVVLVPTPFPPCPNAHTQFHLWAVSDHSSEHHPPQVQLNLFVGVTGPSCPQEECTQELLFIWKHKKEKQGHVLKLNRNYNIRMR